MTNTYNTGNPLGSTDPRDLYDNASNFDDGMNTTSPSFQDRLGVLRKTWKGMEAEFSLAQSGRETEFQQFLVDSGFVSLGNYAAAISVTAYNEYVAFGGSFYRPAASSVPFVTSGVWVGDDENRFSLLNPDIVLRQDLALTTGATLIGVTGYATLQENLDDLAASQDFVTPEQFGAVPGEAADNSAAVQAAITYAEDNDGFLWFPRKYSIGTTTMEQTKRLTVRGVGKYNCGIIYGGTGAAWHCTPPFAGASNTDWSWRDIGITPAASGAGTYGLHIQLQEAVLPAVCFLADSKVTDCFIGDFGLQGLYLDNSVANTDGFFTSQYMFNTITNGILGANVGDSLNFSHNKIYGKNCGVQMTGVAGARQMIIDDNNITTHGGLIALIGVEEPTIRDCQLEHPGYLSGYTGVFGAGVLLFNCFKPRFEGNTLNPDNGAATAPADPGLVATALALTGNTSSAFITQNDIQKGSVDHISTGASTVINTVIDDLNSFYGASPIISDPGTGTRFPASRGSLAYGATIAISGVVGTSITVPGAKTGQYVALEYSAGSQGLEMRGWVSAVNTVSVRIENDSGAEITLSGGSLKAVAFS